MGRDFRHRPGSRPQAVGDPSARNQSTRALVRQRGGARRASRSGQTPPNLAGGPSVGTGALPHDCGTSACRCWHASVSNQARCDHRRRRFGGVARASPVTPGRADRLEYSPWLPMEGRRLVNDPGVTSLAGFIAIATTMCLTAVFLRDPLGVIGWLLASR